MAHLIRGALIGVSLHLGGYRVILIHANLGLKRGVQAAVIGVAQVRVAVGSTKARVRIPLMFC